VSEAVGRLQRVDAPPFHGERLRLDQEACTHDHCISRFVEIAVGVSPTKKRRWLLEAASGAVLCSHASV
jgi:hypothetical protein